MHTDAPSLGVLHDLKARLAAENRGLLVLGTLAILDLADEEHHVVFEDAVARLARTSFYMDRRTVETLRVRTRARRQA